MMTHLLSLSKKCVNVLSTASKQNKTSTSIDKLYDSH